MPFPTARFGWLHVAAASLLVCPSAASLAQQAPQGFLAPPTLQEKAVPGRMLAASFTAPRQGCNPTGDITHNGNLVTVDIDVTEQPNKIYNPATGAMDDVLLRSYGGCLTGPLMEVQPGNTLRVHLSNNLERPGPDAQPCPDGGPPCFNIVNMHYHGLHVSPAGNSDNVLLNIAPQTKFEYEVNVPPDHPSGTFWYHAHRHGSTALQVASGASGVLIVRGNRPYTGFEPGDIDTILHNAAGKPLTEQVFLFQQIPYACFTGPDDKKIIANPDGTWSCPAQHTGVVENFNEQLSSPTVWDNSGRFTSINGAVQPAITNVAAGDIQRWRFIHGGIHDTVNLQIIPMVTASDPAAQLALRGIFNGTPAQQAKTLAEVCPITIPDHAKPSDLVPQFEIATDGLTRTAIRPIGVNLKSISGGIGSNFLQPGYRSDVLVVFPHRGTYCVLNQAATPAERANAGPKGGPGGQGPNETQLLATVIVGPGTDVPGDPLAYIESALVRANKSLPPAALQKLAKGDLTPWRGMPESGPASNSANPNTVSFYIGNLPEPPAQPTDPPGAFGFWLNSKQYSPDRIDFTRQVGATEDWLLTSYVEPHIYHIHVNPFEVMDVTYRGKSIFGPTGECLVPPDSVGLQNQYCGMWHTFKDTVFVQNDYQVRVRTKYDRYIGEFVIHCHILDHEDGGMMTNVEIVPDLGGPGNGLGMPEMEHMQHPTQ